MAGRLKYSEAIERLEEVLEAQGMKILKIGSVEYCEFDDNAAIGLDEGTYYIIRPEIAIKIDHHCQSYRDHLRSQFDESMLRLMAFDRLP